jgi:hypothetical protein
MPKLPNYSPRATKTRYGVLKLGDGLVSDGQGVVKPDFGTGPGKVVEGNNPSLTDDRTADSIRGSPGIINIVPANPTTGQVLTIDASGDAVWQTPSGSSVQFVHNETPAGTIDGDNKVFTTAFSFISNSTQLFLNGIRQKLGAFDYTETGASQITFVHAPQVGDHLVIDYIKV